MPALWLPNPADGTQIAVGFDGSENNDWTALRAETRDGFQFTPRYGPDARPMIWNPAEWGGEIPRGEVHAAVDELFTRWRVSRFYADPSGWYSEIGDWSLRYGEDVVSEWPNDKISRMYPAIRRFETDLVTGRITHDGCPITAVHIANARKVAKPGQKFVLGKPADHQKIDAAQASIVAHEAAADAREAGWPSETESHVIVFR
ncbi:terminase [Rhodococcus rhodnii]|uniref:Terminase n=2 Tax=Rhodococcus rhodnii TaxID=38312 RepID=R7WRU3_9NOCA|nr:hypothetical protein [Rhodococcus rhodnii]EOM78057.1 hypothetical protein Rrhod_0598 [Rhodococcus rhodnii LMG 5362]TXG92614.1 terminase [Rhodococcus rhodnii]